MPSPMPSTRGGGLRLRGSLRMKVTAACGLAFLGLGLMICLVLPRVYEEQAREALREHSSTLARGLALLWQGGSLTFPGEGIGAAEAWLAEEHDLEAIALLDAQGHVLDGWPELSAGWGAVQPGATTISERSTHFLAVHPVHDPSSRVAAVGVRVSTKGLLAHIEGVRWLFGSIFLFACGVFLILTTYITRGIVHPLEDIRDAAMSLADGEPIARVPVCGDREIDELWNYIEALGTRRAQAAPSLPPAPPPRPPGTTPAAAHRDEAAAPPAPAGSAPRAPEATAPRRRQTTKESA